MYSKIIEEHLADKSIAVGDKVSLSLGETNYKGVLMPRPEAGDSNILILKLDNGYNVGIAWKDGSNIKKLPFERENFSFPRAKLSHNPKLSKVSLLYTGGTIGSKVDYVSGGVYMLTKPEELIADVPELAQIANLDVQHLMSIASEDMSHTEWQKIATHAAEALNKGSSGVVITHGTDTMHYTSAALSFMLKDLKGPVVLTGAQRSSDRGSSDAFMNLICSTHVASSSNVGEVGICMHATSSDDYCNFIRGNKVRKMHTSGRDAFKPINSKPILKVDTAGKMEFISGYTEAGKGKTTVNTAFEPKVALVMAYPNSDPFVLDYYVAKGYKGIIIAGTGLGHVPSSTPHGGYNWLGVIKDAVASGLVVGMTSQCLYGRVNSKVYRNLRLASEAGAIYCEDMLPEVAYVKLGWLLGSHTKKESEKLLVKNLAGEITERSEADWSGE